MDLSVGVIENRIVGCTTISPGIETNQRCNVPHYFICSLQKDATIVVSGCFAMTMTHISMPFVLPANLNLLTSAFLRSDRITARFLHLVVHGAEVYGEET